MSLDIFLSLVSKSTLTHTHTEMSHNRIACINSANGILLPIFFASSVCLVPSFIVTLIVISLSHIISCWALQFLYVCVCEEPSYDLRLRRNSARPSKELWKLVSARIVHTQVLKFILRVSSLSKAIIIKAELKSFSLLRYTVERNYLGLWVGEYSGCESVYLCGSAYSWFFSRDAQ